MGLIDDEFDDLFTSRTNPEGEAENNKPHEETKEEREERELKEVTIDRTHNRKRLFVIILTAVVAITLIWVVWSRYFHPYIKSEERGVILKVKNEGTLVKTYEVQMVSEKCISDTVRKYIASFEFTIKNDSLAKLASQIQSTGKRVTVKYEEYKGRLPWRGETNRFATDIIVDGGYDPSSATEETQQQ